MCIYIHTWGQKQLKISVIAGANIGSLSSSLAQVRLR